MTLANPPIVIKADIRQRKHIKKPIVTQNDEVILQIEVYENGVAFDLTGASTISLANERRDGQVIVTLGSAVANVATFSLGTNEVAVMGEVKAKAQFYDSSGRLSTLQFAYEVEKDSTGSGFIPSVDEKTLIEVVLNDGPLRIQEAIDAGVYANEAGDYALTQGDYVESQKPIIDTFTGEQTNLQSQINVLVVDGDSSPESAQARVGSDAVTYPTLKARLDAEENKTTALMAEKSNIADVRLKAQKLELEDASDTFISAITGGATVTVLSIPQDGSVTADKTTFFKLGKNLYDKTKATPGYAVNEVYGTLFENPNYSASDFTKVSPFLNYTEKTALYLAFYSEDKEDTYISGLGVEGVGTNPRTFIPPANANYVRTTSFINSVDTYQLEEGTVSTSYEPFKHFIPQENLEDKPFDVSLIPNGSIEASKVEFISTGKNLFDKSTVVPDKYVNWDTGTLDPSSSYVSSESIYVEVGQSYSPNLFVRSSAYYAEDGQFISGTDTPTGAITIPDGVHHIKVTVFKTDLDAFQLEKGTASTTYEPFGYKLVKSLSDITNSKDEFLLFLPSEICVAFGRTIEIYNSQVAWCGNIDNYHFKWDCLKFKAMKRKFSITATPELVGWYNLDLTVYDNNMNVVATGSTVIKIVPSTIATPKDIANIGDSLSNSKPWLGELRTLSADKFSMVGTRGVSPLKNEGRSGWSAETYLTGASYTYEGEGVNPFWDGARFNWNHYKTTTGLNPSGVQIYLGTNGMTLDPTTNAGNIKQIVDYIRQDDATIPIFLVHTLYRGDQDGMGNEISVDGYAYSKGNWKLEEDRKVFNLMVRLNELLSTYTDLHFVPIALTHDSEYNFGSVSTPVNPRALQTELLPNEATHPQLQGYQQMADTMFSVMAKVWGS
jgi:lysophospholipase L1-like esterase